MSSLPAKQASRGLSNAKRKSKEISQHGPRGQIAPSDMFSGDSSLEAVFELKPHQQGISTVPVTNKREAVWRRLGELAVKMRLNGVSENKITQMLSNHTPGQIEMAFHKHPGLHPDAVADLVLRGRYGFRAGIKKNRKPPDVKELRKRLKAQREQEKKCPVVTQPQVRELLEEFLEGLVR